MNKQDEILNTIKQEKIVPKSKLALNWKHYLFWLFLGVAVIFSSLFLSLAILNFIGVDREIVDALGIGRLTWFLFRTLPLFWLVSFVVILALGFLSFRHTKRAYRYNSWIVVVILLLLASLLSVVLHFAGFNKRAEDRFKGAPILHRGVHSPEERFNFPERGVLAGKIKEVSEEKILLVNPEGEEWEVLIEEDKTRIGRNAKLSEGELIMAIGEKIKDGVFEAKIIKPFEARPFRSDNR
jgi:hypothetical protein